MKLHAELSRAGGHSVSGVNLQLEHGKVGKSVTIDVPDGQVGGLPDSFLEDLTVGLEVLTLYADSTCWVSIGPNPDPTQDPRRLLPAKRMRTFEAMAGDKVAVASSDLE